jgi:hypothetical protein
MIWKSTLANVTNHITCRNWHNTIKLYICTLLLNLVTMRKWLEVWMDLHQPQFLYLVIGKNLDVQDWSKNSNPCIDHKLKKKSQKWNNWPINHKLQEIQNHEFWQIVRFKQFGWIQEKGTWTNISRKITVRRVNFGVRHTDNTGSTLLFGILSDLLNTRWSNNIFQEKLAWS